MNTAPPTGWVRPTCTIPIARRDPVPTGLLIEEVVRAIRLSTAPGQPNEGHDWLALCRRFTHGAFPSDAEIVWPVLFSQCFEWIDLRFVIRTGEPGAGQVITRDGLQEP